MNMLGGSGFELWQYVERKPQRVDPALELGDYGINISIVKSRHIEKSHERLSKFGVDIISPIKTEPDGKKSFYIKDPYDNILKIKEHNSWFSSNGGDIGGPYGVVIGVSNIDESLKLYTDVLGYDKVLYDETGTFEDLADLPNGKGKFRRILLSHHAERSGGFSKLFGSSQLELVQSLDSTPKKLYEGRYWGDIGFIHLCFDIRNMKSLVEECSDKGFPFRVLSDESFDMGDANGHWGYIEDPDGTLVEFVETHKVPLLKMFNWNINLKNRAPEKPLPNWLINAMSMKRVKFKTAKD